MRLVAAYVLRMSAFVLGSDDAGVACARRALLEDEDDVAAVEKFAAHPGGLSRLERQRENAKREAMDAISLFNNPERMRNPSPTDRKKIKYYKLPRCFRAIAYFCIRYFLKLGFLDGLAGFRWHFWQGLWYRWIVDREIGKLVSSR